MQANQNRFVWASTLLLMGFLIVSAQDVNEEHSRQQRTNKPPVIDSFNSSLRIWHLCPVNDGLGCSPSGKLITLEVNASDPDGDKLQYSYSVSAGHIVGEGAVVSWDLRKVPEGWFRANVQVTDGRGGKSSDTVEVKVEICGACDPGCPVVVIQCPTRIDEGTLVFRAKVLGIDPSDTVTYKWSVSPGKIVKGQGTAVIEVKIDSAISSATAVLEVGGLSPACSNEASCKYQRPN